MTGTPSRDDHAWHITQRWQQFEGEARANLLRIVAILTFYLIHLWNFYGGNVDQRFHVMATLLAFAWILLAAGVHLALSGRVFPRWLPALSTVVDVMFLTSVLCISNGPRSPLVAGYFLIVAMSALRFNLPLVRVATLASVAGYVCLLGCAKWPATFGRDAAIDLTVPRYHQAVVAVAILLTGIILGQIVRRVRRLAEEHAHRLSETEQP